MDQISNFFNMIWGIILSFRLNDLIDIILISYIMYKAVLIVRETRATQLFRGFILLIVVAFLAKILNLKTLDFIVNRLFLWGPLIIVVLFQAEFRRILEHAGRAKMGGRLQNFLLSDKSKDKLEIESIIYKISKACEEMSQKKTGAIIIFERKTKLADIIATGVVLNADVSEELIKNLFFKNSPLHDGAVIIRDTKIIAASCFLPKPSKEEYISRVLGARHRAAIGISEISDALVVVVSEETGFISIAENGTIKRHLNRTELVSYLQDGLIFELYEKEKKKNKSKRKWGVFLK